MAKSNHEFIEFKLSEYFVLTAATMLWLHFYRAHRDPTTRNTIINKKNRKNMVWTEMSLDRAGKCSFISMRAERSPRMMTAIALVLMKQDVTNGALIARSVRLR